MVALSKESSRNVWREIGENTHGIHRRKGDDTTERREKEKVGHEGGERRL